MFTQKVVLHFQPAKLHFFFKMAKYLASIFVARKEIMFFIGLQSVLFLLQCLVNIFYVRSEKPMCLLDFCNDLDLYQNILG